MFENISIMGRVIYIIFSIENCLKVNEEIKKWDILLKALWSFPEYDRCIDDFAYKVIECTPKCILDEREDFKTFDYFNEEELYYFRKLYMESSLTEPLDYLMGQINEILAYNLYTSVKPPEMFSLKIINNTYKYIEDFMGIGNAPSAEPFEIYSIYERQCWGNYTQGKEILLGNMIDC